MEIMPTSKFYYTDWTGKRKQKKKEGFKTKKEAKDFEIDFLHYTTFYIHYY